MTIEIGLVLGVIAIALYLFASQKLPLDVTALAIMVLLILIPILGDPLVRWIGWEHVDLPGAFPTVKEGLSGLSSPATVTVLAMFILSAGVQRSGLIHVLGRRAMPFIGNSELRMFLVVMPLVGLVSGFVNNTAAVAVTIPFVLDMSRQLGLQASRLLMPLSFFGMLGGMLTLVGTSTNILASTIAAQEPAFGRNIGMFEFVHVGLLVLLVGMAYFLLIGRRLLPERDLGGEPEDEEEFVVEVEVVQDSGWLGVALEDSGAAVAVGVSVQKLVRDGATRPDPEQAPLEQGDVLQVRGTTRAVADLISSEDVQVRTATERVRYANSDSVLVRALLRNRLLFDGKRTREIGFGSRYSAQLVGIETERASAAQIVDEPLRTGEIVLLEAPEHALPRLRRHPDLVLLSEFEDEFDVRRMWLSGGIMLAVVTLAALTPMPIVLTALLGVIVMAVTNCVTKEDLYSGVPWDVIFLLAGVIPLGVAMTKSGGAEWLGGLLAGGTAGWPPLLVLMALYAFTTVLTEVVSNNASVVILVPVAIALSAELGIGVLPLVLIVMFAASTSFLSPVGYQTNAMVYGTGLYKFTDFARVGAPLNAILMVVTSTAIWFFWG